MVLLSLLLNVDELNDIVVCQIFEYLVIFDLLISLKVLSVRLVEDTNVVDAIFKELLSSFLVVLIKRVQYIF